MEIKTVAVLGAGAVGSYIIWGLDKKVKLGVIGEGERAKRLQKGCLINDQMYYPEVWSPTEAHGVDLLIVSLKYCTLKDVLKSIQTIVDDHTIVMSLMNGVDSEEIIGEAIGKEHLMPSLIKIASRKENGYRFDPETTIGIVFGELQAPYQSKRVQAIESLFENTGIHFRASEYIQEEIWSKFRLNVAHAKGIDLSKADSSSSRGSAVPASARYSTLQDLDAKRHSEIDMFSGALIKMGKELHIPTPYNEYTYHMIKALEEKNDGLFDYDQENQRNMCSK